MITYKLFRKKNGKLYPIYVEADREMKIGEWLNAEIGEKLDENHVKAKGCGGRLALRPGFHSTTIPFTDWIGKKSDNGTLIQRKDTVWCECEVKGKQYFPENRKGSKELLSGWYYFRTNSKQKEPWIISDKLKINRELTKEEVKEICNENGLEPQDTEEQKGERLWNSSTTNS